MFIAEVVKIITRSVVALPFQYCCLLLLGFGTLITKKKKFKKLHHLQFKAIPYSLYKYISLPELEVGTTLQILFLTRFVWNFTQKLFHEITPRLTSFRKVDRPQDWWCFIAASANLYCESSDFSKKWICL